MSDTGIIVALALVALALVALYIFAWRASARATAWIKGLVRYGIPVTVLIVGAVAILLPDLQHAKIASPPDAADRFEYRPQKPSAQPEVARKRVAKKKTRHYRRRSVDRESMSGAEPPVSGTRSGGSSAPGGAGPDDRREDGLGITRSDDGAEETAMPPEMAEAEPMAPPPPSPPVETSEAMPEALEPPPASAERRMAPSGAAAPEQDTADWEIVPVFFGTDRTRSDNAKRLDYGGVRGRRLALGQALVSVPKVHQVPNIERPWALRIPYFDVTIYEEDENPKLHFTMQEIKALTREDFLKLVRARLAKSTTFKDQAFVFVHGFNTTFEHSVYRTAQIAHDLKFDGAPFLYSWPSGGGVASYTYDRESAGQATPYLKDFMTLVINDTGAKAVSVIAHSMGNQPILQVLKDLKNATPEGVIISQVILAAPDVDRDNFENIAKEILGLAKGITLYVAANDQALQFSRRFHGGVPRAGDVPARGPLVINGIDTIDVTSASTDSLGINHSGYAENNALLKDIERLIATGAAPAERHPPKFERIDSGQGAYWKYPAPQ